MSGIILGVSAFYHDSAAALVADGVVVAAAQEERFSRVRHDSAFPRRAVEYCLRDAGVTLDDVVAVAYYEDPALKFRRVLATFAGAGPRAFPAFADTLPPDMTSSMHHDLERGQRLELRWLSGAVIELGATAGVPTPANRAVNDTLILHAAGRDPPGATGRAR